MDNTTTIVHLKKLPREQSVGMDICLLHSGFVKKGTQLGVDGEE